MIIGELQTWLIANVAEVAALADDQKVYVLQSDEGANDHVLLTQVGGTPWETLDADDDHDEIDESFQIEVKCSTGQRAVDVAEAIVDAFDAFPGTMGTRYVSALFVEDILSGAENALSGHSRGRAVVEITITINHRASA